MLNIKKLIYKILHLPLVIEEGSSGNWTYRKWSDGTAECWGRVSKTLSGNSVDTATYVNYPFAFTAPPIAIVSTSAGGANSYLARQLSDGSDASRLRLFFANTYSGETTIYAHAYVIGRWK